MMMMMWANLLPLLVGTPPGKTVSNPDRFIASIQFFYLPLHTCTKAGSTRPIRGLIIFRARMVQSPSVVAAPLFFLTKTFFLGKIYAYHHDRTYTKFNCDDVGLRLRSTTYYTAGCRFASGSFGPATTPVPTDDAIWRHMSDDEKTRCGRTRNTHKTQCAPLQ
jgi:hypothetical protein